MSPWTRWQQGKWRCSWRAPTPDHSAQRSHHPFSRNSLPFMNVRHSPKLHFSPHSAPLSSRLGTERVAFCSPGCQKGRGGGSEEYRLLRCGHAHFCPSTSLGLGLRPATAQESFYESKRFQEYKKNILRGTGVFHASPMTVTACHCSATWRSWVSALYFSVSFFTLFWADCRQNVHAPPLAAPDASSRCCCPASLVWSATCTAVRAGSSRWRAV